jgi:hypothetical protein
MGSGGRLSCYMNMLALNSLPQASAGFRGTLSERLSLVREAGFEGVQFERRASSAELSACRALV